MSITDSLQGVNRLFLDSAPVIYAVERNPQYLPLVRVVFERIFSGLPMGIVSPITLAECLVQPYRLGQTELQQDFIELMTDNQNIEFVPIDDETLAINAAEIRARYNLQLPDAFQITVALAAGCEAFLTNDITFKRVTELRVLVLDDFNACD
ncbi:PilT protein domain protein [Tolypothrix sp. NIES-4075]|uniref:type II toxin-antitoxin system VapC family toxin n=1 Tax=Tolypothrix sp. NIES-4075 TaxID=2005459 RepID=UPI000B5C336B|nr:PIN domain-containing protein [Tolypothrix sp. NIES-4075]GAX44346.1 PilT protein domain protein [Tolypothrix sp. NIES-4075]